VLGKISQIDMPTCEIFSHIYSSFCDKIVYIYVWNTRSYIGFAQSVKKGKSMVRVRAGAKIVEIATEDQNTMIMRNTEKKK